MTPPLPTDTTAAAAEDVAGEASSLQQQSSTNDASIPPPVKQKSISQLVNERKRASKKAREKLHTDEQLLQMIDDKYKALAARGCCKNLQGSQKIKCNCLGILRNSNYRKMVGRWSFDFYGKTKHVQDQQVIEWCRYADHIKDRVPENIANRKYFLLPYVNINDTDVNWTEEDGEELNIQPLLSHRVCTSAVMEVTEIGGRRWPNLVNIAKTTMILKPHGNKGKKRKRSDDDLFAHFTRLEKTYGEVEATRFMRGVTGQLETRDNEDKDLRLPSHMNKRACYRLYGHENGYTISKDEAPVPKYIRDGVEPEQKLASWKKYRDFWNEHYPHLKVGKPSEDICSLCHQFTLRHKFALKMNVQSNNMASIDNALFNNNTVEGTVLEGDEIEGGEDGGGGDGGGGGGDGNDNTQYKLTETAVEEVKKYFIGRLEIMDGVEGETADPTVEQFTNPDPGEVSHDPNQESNELMLIRAAYHIKSARVQRKLYQTKTLKAVECAKDVNMPHSQRTFTLVVDYGQNMEMPALNEHQPGETYYFSPLAVYNLGVVNTAHVANNEYDKPYEHLHAHVYHRGQGQKGGNNVASLIIKTLTNEGIMKEGEIGGELNIIFDNCSGQNKNNTVIALVAYLVELKYFKEVNFIFLVVGHTKNAADRLFNALKEIYRLTNIGTMAQLLKVLNTSDKVTVHETNEKDFLDYSNYMTNYYRKLSGIIKENHIFSCSQDTSNQIDNKFIMTIKQCDLPTANTVKFNMIKQNFYNRSKLVDGKKLSFKDAVKKRPEIIREAKVELLTTLKPPGIPPYTQVELHDHFGPNLNPEDAAITCPKPSEEVYKMVKNESESRKKMKMELVVMKV